MKLKEKETIYIGALSRQLVTSILSLNNPYVLSTFQNIWKVVVVDPSETLNGLIFRLIKLVLFLLCNDSKLWTLKSSALQMRGELKGKIYFPIRNLHF